MRARIFLRSNPDARLDQSAFPRADVSLAVRTEVVHAQEGAQTVRQTRAQTAPKNRFIYIIIALK